MERSSPSAAQWSDLPNELLDLVRSKVMSPRGRIHFTAVCKSWHAALSLHPAPPALPLLLLSPRDFGTETKEAILALYCPEDGGVLRVPLPGRLSSMWFTGSYHGGWIAASPSLFAITRPGVIPGPIVIMNLFTGAELTLSEKHERFLCRRHVGYRYCVLKIIFSEAPTSSSCILAALTTNCKIAMCRLGCPDSGWMTEGCEMEELTDIMFCGGELYGMTLHGESLLRFDVGVNDEGAPLVTAAHQLDVQRREGQISKSEDPHIFEMHGKLAMAVMTASSQNGKRFFSVYELAEVNTDDGAHLYKWSEVHSLGAYALFLGPGCSSKLVHIPAGGRGGVEGNHIYYWNHSYSRATEGENFNGKSYLTGSVDDDDMYLWKIHGGGGMDLIPSVGYHVPNGPYFPTWYFPPDF